jgi:hypothetical protein
MGLLRCVRIWIVRLTGLIPEFVFYDTKYKVGLIADFLLFWSCVLEWLSYLSLRERRRRRPSKATMDLTISE